MSGGAQRQVGQVNPPAGDAFDRFSDDAKMSIRETQRLQREAQARIDSGRHDTIGSAP